MYELCVFVLIMYVSMCVCVCGGGGVYHWWISSKVPPDIYVKPDRINKHQLGFIDCCNTLILWVMLGYGVLSIFRWIASCRTAVSLHQAATKENQGAADYFPGAGPESPQPQLSFWRTTFLTAGYFSSCRSFFLSFCGLFLFLPFTYFHLVFPLLPFTYFCLLWFVSSLSA